MERILDVAQFIFDEYRRISGDIIDEMKLHKLLYFSQRECFAVLGKPLFEGRLLGWRYGPVSPDVRACFSRMGLEADTQEVSAEAAYILKNVILEYGQIASWRLSEMSHREISWLNARKGLKSSDKGNVALKLEDIQRDAEKVRPYDHVWDMYYDEFESVTEEGQQA